MMRPAMYPSILLFLPFLALTRHLSFSKNKSSHDIATIEDDKTHFSCPCREGPPTCCAFPVPIPAVLATAVFFQFLSRVWLKMLCFCSSLSRAWLKMQFFQFPFPGMIENAVFFQFLFFSVHEMYEVLCFSSSLSLSQFPSNSLPSSLPSSLLSSLRGFPVFSKESALQFFLKKKQKRFLF